MAIMARTNIELLRATQPGNSPGRVELDLDPLRAVGAAADMPHGPKVNMEKGGFIIPGGVPVPTSALGKDRYPYGRPKAAGLEEGNTGPGLRKRRRAHRPVETRVSAGETHPATGEARPTACETRSTTIPTGPSPQTLGRRLGEMLRLEELELWYPSARVVRCSSGLAFVSIDVGVIRSLPYRGRLLLEIPLHDPPDLPRRAGPASPTYVPRVRVWARWRDGIRPACDHVYPDASICAWMEGEWIWGYHPLHELADWCTCWLAKVLHLKFLNRWPGRQHCSANVAMTRVMLDEYCRCGGPKQYRECHYPEDRRLSPYELLWDEWKAASAYMWEVRRRGRATTPPWVR